MSAMQRNSTFISLVLLIGLASCATNPNRELLSAALYGKPDKLKASLARGADPNAREKDGTTPLFYVISYGGTNLATTLIDAGADVNARATNFMGTPLIFAAQSFHVSTVKLLIARGADVNEPDTSGFTPLMAAAGRGSAEITKALIAAGADVNAKSTNGWTAWMTAAQSGHKNVAELLKQAGDKSEPNLYLAAAMGDTVTVEALLAKGADVNQRFFSETTALVMAARNGYPETIKALAAHGADVNVRTGRGTTALMMATWENRIETVKVLLELGADPRTRDKNFRTARRWAEVRGYKTVAAMLREAESKKSP